MLDESLKERLIQEIRNELQPSFIILYGSFAKGTSHDASDIDLAYFSDKELSNYERFMFSNKLSRLAGRDLDLVDMRQIDTVFTMQIFSEGIPIYIADENIFITQRIRAYRMYATLNEQRAPIIEAIKESGRVFDHE